MLAAIDPLERLPRAHDGHDLVFGREQRGQRPSDRGLVVDHEDAQPEKRRSARGLGCISDLRARDRKLHGERAAVPQTALDRELAVHRADDLVADREAEAHADAGSLRREKRIEDARDDRGRDADAGVFDVDADVRAIARAPRAHADLVLVGAAVGDRLRGVEQEIQEHLTEPRGVRVDRWRRGVERLHHARAMTDLVVRHLDRRREHRRDVDGAARVVVGTGERAQPAHDCRHARHAVTRIADEASQVAARRLRGAVAEQAG